MRSNHAFTSAGSRWQNLFSMLLPMLVVVGLSGCASTKPYVVLMENADGSVGKIKVTTRDGGSTTLEQARQSTFIGGGPGKTFIVSESQISQDFGAALGAPLVYPVSFLLYFDFENATLTPDSVKLIPQIVLEIRRHPAADVSIIGHTDTIGDDNYNHKLGLERAHAVSKLLNLQSRIGMDRVSIETFGKKQLLIRTPDNTPEPRNRRVEITVR